MENTQAKFIYAELFGVGSGSLLKSEICMLRVLKMIMVFVKLRLHNRFIHVGVDISSYALLAGGRSSYPPVLVKLLYSCSSLVIVVSGVILCSLVLPSARLCAVWDDNNKDMCVHHLYLQG